MSRLQFTLPNAGEMRTCSVLEAQADGAAPALFKFQTFASNRTCETDFHRFNAHTGRYEAAGIVQWDGRRRARVTFGIVEFTLQDVRRAKRATSGSRRFSWNDAEYRWKRAGAEGRDLVCYDWRKRVVAHYEEATLGLEVSAHGWTLLDQVVVTCLLNRWMLSQGYW